MTTFSLCRTGCSPTAGSWTEGGRGLPTTVTCGWVGWPGWAFTSGRLCRSPCARGRARLFCGFISVRCSSCGGLASTLGRRWRAARIAFCGGPITSLK